MRAVYGARYTQSIPRREAEACVENEWCARPSRPDNSDYYFDAQNAAVLGHTRLAIIDLGDNGIQPMHSLVDDTLSLSMERFIITNK